MHCLRSPHPQQRTIPCNFAHTLIPTLYHPINSPRSTILRLLFRFFDPQQGEVRLFGHDIRDLTLDSVRRNISVCPQDCVLFNDSLRYNIHYGNLEAPPERVLEVATQAQLDKSLARMPKGLDTVVGERGLKLSGGEKQRVAIARAMLKDAPVLLADEMTSSLDGATETEVMASLRHVARGRSTIIVVRFLFLFSFHFSALAHFPRTAFSCPLTQRPAVAPQAKPRVHRHTAFLRCKMQTKSSYLTGAIWLSMGHTTSSWPTPADCTRKCGGSSLRLPTAVPQRTKRLARPTLYDTHTLVVYGSIKGFHCYPSSLSRCRSKWRRLGKRSRASAARGSTQRHS